MNEPTPLAIVGLSAIFPKADDLRAYWANLKNGVDAIAPLPATHWHGEDFFNADPKAPDMTYARRGGFISPVDFNPMEFGIAPKDIEATDTTQLLGMVAAKQALADAGYDKRPFNRQRTSVLLGVTGALELVIPLGARLGHPIWRRALKEAGVDAEVAEDVVQRIADGYVPWQENSFPGLLGNVAAGRIASRLDLGGTNCVVDAACASSFAALHLAALELESGRSDLVISGGVDTFNDIFMFMCFSKTPALSPTGNAKPFDKDCDGTILGEGIGMVVLKRLADAERDGDKIYCVLKGIGSSSDGRGGAIYEPRSEGQIQAMERAYTQARITPDTVELIEAHGTGTKVGDATELRSLTKVFRAAKPEGTWAALGSVKSQIGHTKAAAGIAGLIKAALALEQKILPPTIKVNQPLDEAAPGKSPFYLNTSKRPWLPRPNHPRRAGVSAFGFGGTNFHCVLEEHGNVRKTPDWTGEVEIIALCDERLAGLRAQLAALPADGTWPDIRRRAHASRQSFNRAAAFRLLLPLSKDASLASIRDAALAMLDKHPEKTSWTLPNGAAFASGAARGKLAVLFPGQGSQYVGMFRDLACQFPEVLEAFSAADRVFALARPELGSQRLSDFIFPHPAFSDDGRRAQEEALKATDVAQPALGAVSLAALSLAKSFGIVPEATAGHSYGELAALCGAGRIGADSLHRLSIERGRLMARGNSRGDRGSMLAVAAPETSVVELVSVSGAELVIANRNSPGQFVVAGPRAQIEQAASEAEKRSLRAKVLPVAAAFHTKLVADAREPFAAVLQEVPFQRGLIPVYANTTAAAYPADDRTTRDWLADQLAKPVDFIAQIEAMHADGVTTFLELGPGRVLSDLVGNILAGCEAETVALDSSRGSRSGTFDLAAALCRVAALGHVVDLKRWEPVPPPAPAARPAFTIPVSGANVRTSKPPERKPVARSMTKADTGKVDLKMPEQVEQNARPLAPEVAAALQTAQQGMLALQKLQEQTAQLHQQFLAGQEATRQTLQALLGQRRELLGLPPIAPVAASASLPIGLERGSPSRSNIVTSSAQLTSAAPSPKPSASVPLAPTGGEGATATKFVAAEKPASISSPIAPAVLAVVSEKTGYPVEMLTLDMGLDSDLGIDSIKRVEIMAALRAQLPDAPEIKPEHLGSLQTLQQVVDFLSAGARAGGFQPSSAATTTTGGDFKPSAPEAATSALLAVVSEKTGYPIEMLTLDMGLDSDLGIDSIKRVEIMAALRAQLPDAPEIKPEHLGSLRTLQEVVNFLCASPERGSPSRGNPPTSETLEQASTASPSACSGSQSRVPKLSRQILRPTPFLATDTRPHITLAPGSLVWLTDDGTSLTVALTKNLEQRGLTVRRGTPTELLADRNAPLPAALVLLWPAAHGGDAFLKSAFRLIQVAAPALRAAGRSGAAVLVSASRLDGLFGLGVMSPTADVVSGGLAGLVKTAHHEWPEVHCKALDLDPGAASGTELATQIIEEIFRAGPIEVGLFGGQRYSLEIETTTLTENPAPALQRGDLVVVTGGARGVTATSVLELARRHQPRFLLLGRSTLPDAEPHWLTGLTTEAEIKKALLAHADGDRSPKKLEAKFREVMAQREIRAHLAEIRATGALAHYATLDVRDAAAVATTLAEVRAAHGPIRGLIHGAGVLADKLIEQKTEEQFDLVYGTKVHGLRNLLAATPSDDLRLIALFSSYTGRFGRTGQVDYAAANEVLNKMAQAEARRRPQCRVVAFNWGPWNGGMVTEGLRKIFEREGVGLIEPEAGADFFVRDVLAPTGEAVEVLALATAQPVQGGTANLAVLGGNLPPSFGTASVQTNRGALGAVQAAGVSPTATGQWPVPPGAGSSTSHFHPAFDRDVSVRALPCLVSHVMNGRAVLPAALIIEWLAHGAMHGNPGLAFHGFDGFKVLKGLVLEGDSIAHVTVSAAPPQPRDGLLAVPVQFTSRNGGNKTTLHATAEILLADTLPAAPSITPAVKRNGILSKSVYGDGRLFHGPDFQCIEALEVCNPANAAALVRSSPAPKTMIAQPLRPAWLADPLALDAAFQLMILWSTAQRAAPSLPCALRSFRQFAAFPKTGGSRVVASITSAETPVAVADLQFFDRNGGLVALGEGYEFVVDPNLRDAFRQNSLTA
jgi:acyl transferase domain-containing protein/NAD(P)-dependent dehydrogenase (short-subunit alcohol dehydrogenase family)